MMRFFVEGVGLLGPGLDGWPGSQAILRGEQNYVAAATNLGVCDMLPAAERRRAGVPIKLALGVGQEAFRHAQKDMSMVATVFTSSGGDNDNVHAINEILAMAPREVSPTRFHNSVHNAAAGYWCIAAKTHQPSTSLCAYDFSFAAGLLESAAQVSIDGTSVVLIAYDHPYPYPMSAIRKIDSMFGTALVLARESSARSLAKIEVEWVSGRASETLMLDAALESLRCGVPAARCLPLLAALANRRASEVVISYFDDNHLNLRVAPC